MEAGSSEVCMRTVNALGGGATAGTGVGEDLDIMVDVADVACGREGEEENCRVVCLERGRGRLRLLFFFGGGGILKMIFASAVLQNAVSYVRAVKIRR